MGVGKGGREDLSLPLGFEILDLLNL